MEEFYYDAIYHALQTNTNNENRAITIRRLKAKLLRVMSKNMRGVLLDTSENDSIKGEDITIYHHIRSRKRQQKTTNNAPIGRTWEPSNGPEHNNATLHYTSKNEIQSPPDRHEELSRDGNL
jgi:hypothetical protein